MPLVDVDVVVDVAEREDDARTETACWVGGNTACDPSGQWPGRRALEVAEQVHPEIVEAKVGDGDAGLEVFEFDDFVLEPAELLFAEDRRCPQGEEVVVAGGGHIGDHHAAFDALLQADVLVQGDVGPVVDELDRGVRRADAVDAAKSLDDADRVPMNVVIDEVIAVLKILSRK